MTRTILTSLALVATSFTACIAADVDVYLLGGQSNMQGIGLIKNLKKEQLGAIPRSYFFKGKTFEKLNLGKTVTSYRTGEIGPEFGFSKTMSAAGKTIYLIKYSASGMPLHHGWNGNKWIGGKPAPKRSNFYPGTSPSDPNKGKLYLAMHKRFSTGLAKLKKQGHTPHIKGFLWMQGEQDSKHKTSATHYASS